MKKKTYAMLVLDETGSMMSIRDQTVSAVAEYLDGLKSGKGIRVTVALFNSQHPFRIVVDNKKAKNAQGFTHEDYNPSSTTPLFDAIGQAIRRMEQLTSNEDCKVIIAIMTDGLENASREYSREDIFALVEKKRKEGWAFAFLGANIDSFDAGGSIGIAVGSTRDFDAKNIVSETRRVAEVTMSYSVGDTQADHLFDD